jgi:hypothetical protein
MKEDFSITSGNLKFDTLNLRTSNNEEVTVANVGQYLELAGPDFFNAQIRIDNQMWAGNVEIHLKSSYVHHQKRCGIRKRNSPCSLGTRYGNLQKE